MTATMTVWLALLFSALLFFDFTLRSHMLDVGL